MPREIHVTQPRALAYRGLFVAAVAAVLSCLPSAILHAESPAVRGYITAVHPPDGFDVNGEHVTATVDTQFGAAVTKAATKTETKNPIGNGPTRDTLQIGAWVEVFGERDRNTKTVAAKTVLIRDDWDSKLSGLGVIDKVISTAPELVFAADGYHIRVTPATEVKLPKDMKSAADVHAGMWVLYEGKLGQDGLLIASKARFVSTDHSKAKSEKASGDSGAPAATQEPSADGGSGASVNAQPPNNVSNETEQQTEFRGPEIQVGSGDTSVTYKISKHQTLQSRVQRVGMSLIPAYQKQLPADDPAKISFCFVAVNDPAAHEVRTSLDWKGLIVVSAQLAGRFKNDDQLAAVLAEGIASILQQQAPMVVEMNRTTMAVGAGMAAVSFIPYAGAVADGLYDVYAAHSQYEIDKVLREQPWRVALELMADAGYDPWQAPEAWRLAAPGKLPADTSTLKYPDHSGYQLSILNLMYKKTAPTNAALSGPTANSSASTKP
jgi:hypothetical protein